MNLRKLIAWTALCTGCISPADKFDEFVDRERKLVEDAGVAEDAGGGGSGVPLTPDQIAGTYLYVVSTTISRANPVVYELEVEADTIAGTDNLKIRLRERALACTDRKTPVAEFGEWRESVVKPDGVYMSDPIDTFVPAAANAPLGCSQDGTTNNVVFSGTIQNPATADMPDAKVDFWCGTMTGSALGGAISLNGSTFTATRITDPKNYPPVVINCAKTPAAELSTP